MSEKISYYTIHMYHAYHYKSNFSFYCLVVGNCKFSLVSDAVIHAPRQLEQTVKIYSFKTSTRCTDVHEDFCDQSAEEWQTSCLSLTSLGAFADSTT